MPPRGGRGQSEEVKTANFETYQNSDEHKICTLLNKMWTTDGHELKDMHPGSDDILDDWDIPLSKLFKLTEILKVPGRKAKCKLQFLATQQFVLTSFILQPTNRACSAPWCSNVFKKISS